MQALNDQTVKVKVKVKLKRSSVKPQTKADKQLSIKHLQESVNFHKKHVTDHKKLLGKGGSKKYNKDHIKHHKKSMKDDQKLIKDRQKLKPKQRSARNKRLEGTGSAERKRSPEAFGTRTMSQKDIQSKAMTSAYKNTQVYGTPLSIPKGMTFKQPSWAKSSSKLKRAMKKL